MTKLTIKKQLPGRVAAAAVYSVVGCSGEEGVIVPEIAIVILPLSLVTPRVMLKK